MKVDPYLVDWLRAFVITNAVELPIVVGYVLAPSALKVGRRVSVSLFVQLASHPAVWFIFPRLGMTYWVTVVVSELWAFLSEAAFYGLVLRVPPRRAVIGALAANAASFGTGLALYQLGWL